MTSYPHSIEDEALEYNLTTVYILNLLKYVFSCVCLLANLALYQENIGVSRTVVIVFVILIVCFELLKRYSKVKLRAPAYLRVLIIGYDNMVCLIYGLSDSVVDLFNVTFSFISYAIIYMDAKSLCL